MVTEMRNIDDTFLSQNQPDENFRGHSRIRLNGTSGGNRVGVLFLPLPGRVPGMVIQSYKLRLYASASAGAATYEVRRFLSKRSASSMTWDNRPTTSGAVVTATPGALTTGGYIDLDLTTLANNWLTGTPNYGIRIDTTASSSRDFYSAQGGVASRAPRVLIEWSAPPAVPSGFAASGERQFSVADPVLPWVYSDPSGSPMTAYQYQQNPTNSWTTPAVDSGPVLAGSPSHQLAGVANGSQFWYRVRHQNAAGLWSTWSAPQQAGRTTKQALTILVPGASPGNVVNDVTPTVAWSTTGVQTSWQAFVTSTAAVQDSRHQVDDDTAWSVPKALTVGASYSLEVRAWDDVERVSLPNDPAYAVATRTFTVQSAPAGVPVPTATSAQAAAVGPAVTLTWNCASADGFVAERRELPDGAWVAYPLDVGDVAQGGTAYAWTDVTAPPQRQLEYRVRAVLNGSMGNPGASNTLETFTRYIWLLDPEDPTWVLPVAGGDEGTWTMGEQSTFVEVRGDDMLHLVHEGFRGYEGSCTGIFASDLPYAGGLTAQQQRDRAYRTKREPVKLWRLVIDDINIPVRLRNVVPIPRPRSHEVTYGVSFEFAQQGELPWEDEV